MGEVLELASRIMTAGADQAIDGLDPLGGHPRSRVQPREDVHHGERGEEKGLALVAVKAEIVELCGRADRPVGQIAKDFDLTETAVCDWVKQADAGERDGLTSGEREKLLSFRS